MTPPAAVAPLEISPLAPDPAEIDVGRVLELDRVLSEDIGVRVAGTPEDDRATNYIASTFTKAGYRTERRAFSLAEGGQSHNVVARHPSADYSAGYLLIGGHHDTVPGAPGANDN
ncbi:MAG: M28 family peptidase, partial [Actinomycetota bacterium]